MPAATGTKIKTDGRVGELLFCGQEILAGVQHPMRWTCPKGHDGQLATDLAALRELIAMLALTHQCPQCETSYLLPKEAQHCVLRHFEERAVRALLKDTLLSVAGTWWAFEFVRLRLIARFPPDATELEVIATADENSPRIRIALRISLDVLRSAELLKRELRSELDCRQAPQK